MEIGARGDSGAFATADLAFLPGALRLTLVVAGLRAGSFTGELERVSLVARVARLARVAAALGDLMSLAAAALVTFPESLRLVVVVVRVGLATCSVSLAARVVRVARATGLGASTLAGAGVTSAAFSARLVVRVAVFFGEAATAAFAVFVFLAAGAAVAVGASSCAGRGRFPVTRLGAGAGVGSGLAAAALPAAGLPWERVATMLLAVSVYTRRKWCVLAAVLCWQW